MLAGDRSSEPPPLLVLLAVLTFLGVTPLSAVASFPLDPSDNIIGMPTSAAGRPTDYATPGLVL